ncbi:MAG: leucyl/phenylalanyl-tRNA--protein transferase [Azorhizobium sp. 32-67-21]|nr:MAG: leucyl/phenylalanyl-tRNA--protein transferase [Azorhizobium sp. 32-67-21]
MSRTDHIAEITPEVLLKAYACGIFPMAETADDPGLFWIEPERRGIIPLDAFHVPSRLARTVRSNRFEVRVDTDFEGIINGCAAPQEGRDKTWINARIRSLYGQLFRRGQCHTVESWRDGKLVGGLYGVRLGVPRRHYQRLLEQAVHQTADFYFWPADRTVDGGVALQSVSQTS